MLSRFWYIFFAALLLLSTDVYLPGQTTSAVVKGTVSDASGGVVQGAKLLLTNQETNITREATSLTEGLFSFAELPPGSYKLDVEQAGFQKWSGSFVLQVGQTAVIEPKLAVGSLADTVVVNDAAPVITTEGMQVSDVKDALRIHQLPLNGRQISQLFTLTPGVEDNGSGLRVNGLKVGAAEITQDGVTLVDRFSGGIQRVQPGLDTVQEFRIETSGSSARYARPATLTLVTKSGTNQLHGTLFETFRNNAAGLRARQRQDGNTSAKLIRNEFGVSAGGPVWFPKLYNGRDKTFWFFAYEGLRQRQSVFDEDYVPTPAMFNGDFSQIFDNNGVQTHIYDPLTTNAQGIRTQFLGDVIPPNRISPFWKVMQSITHTPTSNDNPFQSPNLDTFYPLKNENNTLTAKGDHRFSSNDNLSGRFTKSHFNRAQTGGRFGSPAAGLTNGYGTGLSDTFVYSGTVTETHVFTPTLMNEFLAAVNRNPNHQGTLADFTNWSQKLGLPNPFGTNGWPTICAGNFNSCWDADNVKDQKLTAFHGEDNVTWVKGKHSFAFGGKVRKELNNVRELQQSQGSHDFGESWTALYDSSGDQAVPFTGVGLASMALGLPTFLSNQYNRGYYYFRQTELGFYAHDSWKLTPRLTLELGLRWDKWTAYKEKFDRLVNVDVRTFATQFQVVSPNDTSLNSIQGIPPTVLASWANRGLTWTTANKAGLPSSLIPSPNNDFGPRLGAAYRLNDKTSVRAGYGEYFWTLPLSQILQTSRINPPLNLRYTNPLGNLDGTDTYAVRTAPQANYFVGQAAVDINGVIQINPNSAQSFLPYDYRNWNDTRAREWQFTIERQLMKDTALRLSYIGDHGSNLEQRYNLNSQEAQINYETRTGNAPPGNRDFLRVNPNWNFNGVLSKLGYSNTHSAQVQVERRYSAGLAFQVFYTFTRSLTTTDAGAATSGGGSINDTSGGAQVPENNQILGEPNLNFDQRLRLVYYNSTVIPPHRLSWNGIFDLPFGRGKHYAGGVSKLVDAFVGGWQLATIGSLRSGTWLSVSASEYLFGNPTLSSDQRLNLTYNGRSQRLYFAGDFDPTRATNVDLAKLEALVPVNRGARLLHPLGSGFDNRLPVTLANGTVRPTPITDTVSWNSRAFILGPRNWNVDASVFKNFNVTERVKLRFTSDFFNALNHPNDVNPNNTTGLQDLSQQGNEPRIIQFSLRVSF